MFLHGVAFLSWNQHPEPTGSRRATPLLHFQHSAGHLPEGMVEGENTGQVFMASRFLISFRPQFDAERAFASTIGTDIYAPSPLQS
jgi:hypothetical protein